MADHQRALAHLCRYSRRTQTIIPSRSFSISQRALQPDVESASSAATPPPPPPPSSTNAKKLPDPNFVSSPRSERRLIRAGIYPVGSRRRRAVLASLGSSAIPFEQLPYQCFQEARKVLHDDRQQLLQQVDKQRGRLHRLAATEVTSDDPKAQVQKQRRVDSMRQELEHMKILADINDPLVRKRFEDGLGDMNKPIYRHYAERQWRKQKRLIDVQRISQFNLVPDYLMALDPVVDLSLSYNRQRVEPGAFVESTVSEHAPPDMKLQVFNQGERMITVAVIDGDVPDVERDGFSYRCHFLACNIPVSPTSPWISLSSLSTDNQVVLPWLAPWSQKGAPYHRLPFFILEQPAGVTIDISKAKTTYEGKRLGFKLRSFVDKFDVTPVGATLMRTKWDEGMDDVMRRLGVPEAEMELKRKRVEPQPYSWKPRDGKRYR